MAIDSMLPPVKNKPLGRGQWWLCFVLSTYVMSLCFKTFKTFTLVPSLLNGLEWGAVMVLMALLVMILVYDSYVQEKTRERVQRPIRFFEWLISKRFLLKGDWK